MASDSVDIAELTATQQEALQTYTAVTDQDPIAAIPILRRAEWNVQIAVTRFYEGEPTSDPVAEAQAAIPVPTSRQTANLQYEALLADNAYSSRSPSSADTVRRVDTTSNMMPQYQPGLLLSILLTPFNIVHRIFSIALSPFSFLVPQFITRLINNLFSTPRPSRRALPPAETAHRFIREFAETYSSETTLPWTETGFNLSVENAKTTQKFLLVVLLSPSHDDTASYVSETLLTPTFSSFLSTHRDEIILWGGNVQDPEAYQASTNLNCTKFPFLALICQTPPSPTSANATRGNMTVVLRAAGPMAASELTAKLGAAMTSHSAALRASRVQHAEQHATRTLRQEQDSAYERSLAQDRERARRRKEEEEAKRKAEEAAKQQADEAEQQRARRDKWRLWRSHRLKPEPETDKKDAVRVSIRMTDGQRVIRRFNAEDDIEEIYAYIECHESTSEPVADGNIPEEPDKGYHHEYQFRLVSPMPRTVYTIDDGGTIGAKIGKSANLIVELVEEEEDNADKDTDEAGPSSDPTDTAMGVATNTSS